MKLAISSYSFHRFGNGPEGSERPSFASMIDTCARLGIDGLELLGVHFTDDDLRSLPQLKQAAALSGIDLVAVSAHHNFVVPDEARRRNEIDKLSRVVDLAASLGAPIVRAFGGRWGTRPSFSEYMAAGGKEPPLEGHTDEEGYGWSIEAFKIAGYYAGHKGVTIAVENHWGFTESAEGVLKILNGTNSPWVRGVLDTGNFNFLEDPYAEMEALAPHAVMVHAKTYFGGGLYYTAELDYPRILRILKAAGFQGYVSIEFEGKDHPETAIPDSVALLKDAMKRA